MGADTGKDDSQRQIDLEILSQMECARDLDRMLRKTATIFIVTTFFSKCIGGFAMFFDGAVPI
jgi:hypothetical protein